MTRTYISTMQYNKQTTQIASGNHKNSIKWIWEETRRDRRDRDRPKQKKNQTGQCMLVTFAFRLKIIHSFPKQTKNSNSSKSLDVQCCGGWFLVNRKAYDLFVFVSENLCISINHTKECSCAVASCKIMFRSIDLIQFIWSCKITFTTATAVENKWKNIAEKTRRTW